MKLLEYEAKSILNSIDIPVPRSYIADDTPDFLPAVIKSQVPIGGRGKAGGIKVVKTDDEYFMAVKNVSVLEIKGFTPKTLLAEELLDIDRELYLSVLIDKQTAEIILLANKNGGVEVEENSEDSYWRQAVNKDSDFDQIGESLADYFDTPGSAFALQDFAEKLCKCFVTSDALLLEINPLVITKDGSVVAGDCKMELDDAAAYRHNDWQFEAEKTETNFVTLDPHGTVATVANGAGLAMATVDAVADAGLTPANFLDIGGGANEASVLAAFERLVQYPNVRVIIINIFAGITRCDEVAKAIISARNKLDNLPPLAVRLAGTNYEQAAALLKEQGIEIQPSLGKAIEFAKEKTS
ncbi:succinate--CoA ligase subunit beta [Candidatus Saccharibacteria bacterium]|nr:succinate--CoA ligase subunit beta [Candidatus Saccharibacteria bacterium]